MFRSFSQIETSHFDWDFQPIDQLSAGPRSTEDLFEPGRKMGTVLGSHKVWLWTANSYVFVVLCGCLGVYI